jgi:hypothetical protein
MTVTPSLRPGRAARLFRGLCLAALCVAGAYSIVADAAQTPHNEKASRTPAQRKLDSQLLYALYERRGESRRRGTPRSDVEVDGRGRVLVDIRARVSKSLLARVRRLGGEIVSTSERYNTIIARFPLTRLETLAARSDVRFIGPASKATTN